MCGRVGTMSGSNTLDVGLPCRSESVLCGAARVMCGSARGRDRVVRGVRCLLPRGLERPDGVHGAVAVRAGRIGARYAGVARCRFG